MIEPIVVVAVVIACTALYMQYLWRRRRRLERAREEAIGTAARQLNIAPQQDSGLELLAWRYARGEIERAEYLQKKGDIVGTEIPVDGAHPNSAELLNRGPVRAGKQA
jgi:uncharacterized membrane protein